MKPFEKREGGGSHNWGNQTEDQAGEPEQQQIVLGEEAGGVEGEDRGEARYVKSLNSKKNILKQ